MASSSYENENENVVVMMGEALIITGDNVINGELINGNKLFDDQQHPPTAITRTRRILRDFSANLQAVMLGTKLFLLFPAIPLAVAAQNYSFGRPWIFALSLIGLTPLAERVSFLTEQIACYTSPTVGGLLNATCGNATELIIALFALHHKKIHVLKYSLLGSIISNLLLVLGSSLVCGGLANFHKEQTFDRRETDVNSLLLMLGLLCHLMPLVLGYAAASDKEPAKYASPSIVGLARASSVVMLIAYVAYLFFQLKPCGYIAHQASQDDPDDDIELDEEETSVIGFWSAFLWLCIMTVATAALSEFVVGTIEDASNSWGISVSFISIILLPIVGNAAEHAGSVIFAFKNKLDISLGVALGSASQISMFVVPLCVIVAWIMGIEMDLDFGIIETVSLAFTVILTALTLQDGNSHYMKGVILLFSYIVIGACFFLHNVPLRSPLSTTNMELSHRNLGSSDT